MSLKVLTPSNNTGYDDVSTVSDYRSGMIAARTATGAITVAGAADDPATGTKPVGILGEDRLTSGLQRTSQVEELITITISVAVALAHNAVVSGSQRLVRVSDSAVLALTTDYTIDATNGTITGVSGGPATLLTGDVVRVTYTFSLNDDFEKAFRGPNFKGSTDDTEGSHKATVWKGYGEFQTDQFVTSRAYAIGDLLRPTIGAHALGVGFVTNESSGATVAAAIVGRVNKLPTASDPFIGFETTAVLV